MRARPLVLGFLLAAATTVATAATIDVVATTADQWDDRLKQMFGGATHQEALAQRIQRPEALTKPGQGLYL